VIALPYGEADAQVFARTLIEFGRETARAIASATFAMPHFKLTVASDSGDYLALCRRALVDDSSLAPDRPLDLAVLDYSTHPEMPRGIWKGHMFGQSLLEQGLGSTGLQGSINVEHKLLQFLDITSGQGIEALAQPGQYPPWIASFPLRNFLHWAYQSLRWRLVHAGTLSIDGAGVLLVGAGGAGKSGTTLAGIAAGLDSAGDDYIAIEDTDAGIFAHPVMKLMKQDAAGLSRLNLDPRRLGVGAANWQGKHEFDFTDIGAGRRAPSVRLKAILLPRITRACRTTITPTPQRLAMAALAPNNFQQLPGGWGEGLAFIARLARILPAFHVDLSENPREIADTIAHFIQMREAA
jgi:hypothetical protein